LIIFNINGAILSVIFELDSETDDNILTASSEICDCFEIKALHKISTIIPSKIGSHPSFLGNCNFPKGTLI